MLLQNGYVSISSLDSKTQNGYVTAYDIKPDFAKKLADVTLDFLKHLNSTISSSSSSVSSSSNSVTEKKTNLVMQRCNFCNKKSVNNTFKQCIGCMQVHYCSPKCQQYDWEFHKNICNCLAGKKQLYLVTDIHLDENNE
ncbi:MAG: zinc finger MYND domain-containing protein [Candidatus Babeliales bacterium]|nr:zinc finger MYND domain-containing protein [Candidatus Babeliales bacterium]